MGQHGTHALVVIEDGTAHLYGKNQEQRAKVLIAIFYTGHREALERRLGSTSATDPRNEKAPAKWQGLSELIREASYSLFSIASS